MPKVLRPRGFWRRDRQVAVLCAVIGGEMTAAEAARKLHCNPVMINQQAYRFRRDLRIAYATGRMVPGLVLAMLNLSGEANEIMDRIEANRMNRNGGDASAAQRGR